MALENKEEDAAAAAAAAADEIRKMSLVNKDTLIVLYQVLNKIVI